MTTPTPQFTLQLGDHEAVALMALWGYMGFLFSDNRYGAQDALQLAQGAIQQMGPERLKALRDQFAAIRETIMSTDTPEGGTDGQEESRIILL